MNSSGAGRFAPVTEAVLARARQDPAFRQQLLTQSLNMLLERLHTLRGSRDNGRNSASQVREGAVLAVRLAELIQARGHTPPPAV
jgi:hypothetical protein